MWVWREESAGDEREEGGYLGVNGEEAGIALGQHKYLKWITIN